MIIICLYILVHYDGFIVLTGDAIILRRLWVRNDCPITKSPTSRNQVVVAFQHEYQRNSYETEYSAFNKKFPNSTEHLCNRSPENPAFLISQEIRCSFIPLSFSVDQKGTDFQHRGKLPPCYIIPGNRIGRFLGSLHSGKAPRL